MVGNGVADDEFDGNALVPFVHGMGLISDTLYEAWISFIYLFISVSMFLHMLLLSHSLLAYHLNVSLILGLRIH